MTMTMTKHDQRESTVILKRLNLFNILEGAKETIQRDRPDCIEADAIYDYAAIETPQGLIVLNNEGVGSPIPISNESPLKLEIFGKYTTDKKGSYSFDIIPKLLIVLNETEVNKIMVNEEVNLKDFIRVFGDRLEHNFQTWNAFFSRTQM